MPDGGEKVARFREGLQQHKKFPTDGHPCGLTARPQLFPPIDQHAALPVDVCRRKAGRIRLGCSGFIKQLVVGPTLHVSLRRDDERMLFWRNSPLALAANFRPGTFAQNRPRQPASQGSAPDCEAGAGNAKRNSRCDA